MAKRKEIKFRDRGYVLEGRQGNLIFALYNDNTKEVLEEQTYYVVVRHKEIERLGFSTAGYRNFTMDAAKEFCQKIAAGEIDPEALLMEFAAEDMAKEQVAVREITEKAKKLHARLDAMGLKYRDLLELEVLAHSLGDMGHNILLAYERGEGWPVIEGTGKGTAAHVVEVQGRQDGETGQDFVGTVKQIIQDLSESRRPFQ